MTVKRRTANEIKALIKKAGKDENIDLTTKEIEFLYRRMPIDLLAGLIELRQKIKCYEDWQRSRTESRIQTDIGTEAKLSLAKFGELDLLSSKVNQGEKPT